jgi:hypothetical protein
MLYHDPPITAAARSKARTVFSRPNTGVMDSNPTRGMDVCVCFFCVCIVLSVDDGLIPRPTSPTDCECGQETEKAAKTKQRAVAP